MDNIGIYIHIPFCEQKCPYCDFYSISDNREYDRYVLHLIQMIQYYSDKYTCTVDTIYFGGGTPSVIGSDRLVKILNAVKDSFSVAEYCETTVEVNPCSAGKIDFAVLRKAGFNRISIGLQSSNAEELALLGRRHTASDAKLTVQRARHDGFDNISLDLMLCVPGQTKSSLYESIKFCKDCDVEHISAYILKIEENTYFYDIKDTLRLFDDDEQSDIYNYTVDVLDEFGYKQYEISNFSKPSYESKHNLHYWRDEEYIGIGPSAHSYINGERFHYSRSLDEFYKGIIHCDGTGGDIEEFIMLSLRLTEGLNLSKLRKRYNYTITNNFTYKANKLKSSGLLNYNDDNISLTKKGFLVSNSIISYLLDEI